MQCIARASEYTVVGYLMKKARYKITVLIKGATGFVGKELARQLSEKEDFLVRLAVRSTYAENFCSSSDSI